MTDYHFVSTWRLQAPIEQVWDEIFHTERWPSCWKYVHRVDQLDPGTPTDSADASTWSSPPGCPTGSASTSRCATSSHPPPWRPSPPGAGGRRALDPHPSRRRDAGPLRLGCADHQVVDKPGRAGRPAGLSLEPRRAHARGRRGSGAPARCRAGADEFRVEGRVASANPRLGLPSACAAGPGRCALAKAHIATAETLSGEQRAQAPRGIRGGPRGAAMEPQSSASPLPDGHPEPRRRCPLSRGSSARPFGENPARQLSGPLSWEFGARGRIRTDDLPITSRRAFVQRVPPRPVLAAHVSGVVHPVRS
jgi:hypothetical protein